jgi:hypothetical protein
MDLKVVLKWLVIFGGIIEIVIGILLLIVDIFLSGIGLITIPIFNQMAGTFLLGFGILLVFSAKEIDTYRIILLVNILLRSIMIICSLMQLPFYPEFVIILIPALIYDILWSIIVIMIMRRLNLLRMKK